MLFHYRTKKHLPTRCRLKAAGARGGGDSRVLEGAIARKTAVASEPIWERFESLGKRRRYLGGSDPICYYCHQANPGSYVNARPQKNRWPQTRGTKEFSRRGLGLVQGRGRPRLALFSSGREMGTLIERRIGSASRNLWVLGPIFPLHIFTARGRPIQR